MAESVIIEIGVDDQGTPVLKNVTGELEKLEGQTSKTGDASQKLGADSSSAAGSMGKMGPAALAAGAAVAGIAVAAAAAAAAVVGLYKGIDASVEAFKEQDEVNRALERSLRRAGFAGGPLREELDAIGDTINQVATETMFGDEELSRMASSFIQLSGEATATEADLRLIADIAAETGQSGEAAARMYADALQGQLRPSLARTTALTEEQIVAINETEDSTERARLAQEALAQAYGGTSTDINPLTLATKNLEDAQGDLMQAIGQLVSEGGALEPFLDGITAGFRRVEAFIGENREAIQRWILDGVITAVEAVGGFIDRLQQLSPVIALVIEYVQQVGRNFSMLVSSFNIIIRTTMAFQRAIQSGVVRSLANVLDAAIKVADFLGRDVPAGVRNARESLDRIGDSIEEDMSNHLDSAGESVDNIREKFNESRSALDNIVERSAAISGGLGMAGDMAERLRGRLVENRDALAAMNKEADREGEGTGAGGDGGAGAAEGGESDADRAKREAQEAEIARLNQIAQIRIDALEQEDEFLKAILESEARRLEIEAGSGTELEKRLALMEEERGLAETMEALDEEIHQRTIERKKEQKDAERGIFDEAEMARKETIRDNMAIFGQIDQQIAGLGTLTASVKSLSEMSWDNAEAYEAMGSAASGFAALGGQLSGMITDDRKKAAKIEAAFNAAASVAAFAGFASSGFTAAPLGIAAAQHALAAANFAAIGGGGGGGGATASQGASGGGGSRTPRQAQMIDQTSRADSRPQVINYNLNGTFIEDSNAIARRVDDLAGESQRNRFVAGRGMEGRG